MTLVLSSELEREIQELVSTGEYASAEEVVREGVSILRGRIVEAEALREEWRQQIAVGLQQLEVGKSVPLTDALVEDIKARGRARLAERAQGGFPYPAR